MLSSYQIPVYIWRRNHHCLQTVKRTIECKKKKNGAGFVFAVPIFMLKLVVTFGKNCLSISKNGCKWPAGKPSCRAHLFENIGYIIYCSYFASLLLFFSIQLSEFWHHYSTHSDGRTSFH